MLRSFPVPTQVESKRLISKYVRYANICISIYSIPNISISSIPNVCQKFVFRYQMFGFYLGTGLTGKEVNMNINLFLFLYFWFRMYV